MRPPSVSVTIAEIYVQGPIQKDIVQTVVRRNQNQIRMCYVRAYDDAPPPSGQVTLVWLIDEEGLPFALSIKPDDTLTEIGNCIRNRLRRWRYPPSLEDPTQVLLVIEMRPFDSTRSTRKD